ncbi:MAG: hypothetical protein H3Z53_05285 [archaeon]|nr:hypothetical protein [archaeon]
MTTTLKYDVQKKLEAELERLKRILQVGYELKVRWIPNGSKKLSGEVKGDFIYIYDENEEMTINTLKHEFLDYTISQVIEPYKQVTNSLISLMNGNAYKKKEKLVEKLCLML